MKGAAAIDGATMGMTEAEKADYWFGLYLEETTKRRSLERQLAQARIMQVYSTDECDKHRGNHVWDMQLTAGFHNVVKVCPICEKNAKSARP